MKIHEYQAKNILREYNITVPRGEVATTPEMAREIAASLKTRVVVKAQIHAGGRGKGGGVRLAASPEEAFEAAKGIIGMNLVTHQTGPEGKLVRQVLVEEAPEIEKELYLGLVVDRSRERECMVYMASEAGGMDIEEIARTAPEKIVKAAVHPAIGFSPFQARKIAYGLGLDKSLSAQFSNIARSLHRLFVEKDASLVEINPLVITADGNLMAVDTKLNFDDDGLFRHPEIKALRDETEEEPLEVEAVNTGVNYIKLDGNVGCMVNGAGLAMTTMDLIKLAGGEPANFLDVGGGASPEQIEKAFRILTSDPKVKAILVNIFGGILRCDRVATGVVEAASKIKKKLPMVVRLQGTNVEEGRKILQESDLTFEVADELYEAAQKAVELSKR
ncbi:MAG: succinate--CoA ligase subunit beta [Syntrophaceae bacterium CG2_30_49_12]|nr:MAG: succinate--CoA ligase subunit beta [Syntrophaceae bacterium CG2_30_49_12]PIP06732.1 MAG: ADP-forming succinate--CoA ligase subunit beta [Syntrophobacterales bacterium CG23_combo_of_CG06-09_8_20_14_all_48_27]PJC76988.1 MAG: ADP-forming succinate--CoA ligase subunit beta [Syntrophobacterales bacterium CG_4_8_14_3_um_filter_49_14]